MRRWLISCALLAVSVAQDNVRVTPETIEAISWRGRAALDARQYDQAQVYANRAYRLAQDELKRRPLDAEAHLPIALGAAIEVEAQARAAKGERDSAVVYLRAELAKYRSTSIHARIQKNINLLSLEGKPAPPMDAMRYAPKGKPALLFFWAHWCGDCKGMVPDLVRISQELTLVGITQHYGYIAGGEEAPRDTETKYIEEVRRRYYAGMPVSISEEAFKVYGCSTTPTLVLLDRNGIVRMYHPGRMTYDELKAALGKRL